VLSWFGQIDPAAFDRMIDADVGPRTLSQILERTRFHAAQHLRQVYVSWTGLASSRIGADGRGPGGDRAAGGDLVRTSGQ